MNKTPGGVQSPQPMTKVEREAGKAFRKVEAQHAMTDHDIARTAFAKNHARLKAERLAREAAAPPVTNAKARRRTRAKKNPQLSKPAAGWSS
ncbi:MAG: hypothetical protein QOH32_1993 [Bradyrhizobium sp.]|nr:hypothetical protein [Bradyrhizobium sp.]